jgi:putative PIN family toxin of toxin-antitoxin system
MRTAAVVVDTNVFVAAGFNPRSASAKIVEAVKRGQIRMVWNEATRREIERILRHIPPLRSHAVSDLFRPEGHYAAATHPERFSFVTDPDDRKFAALAHAAGAALISNDDDLLRHRDRLGHCQVNGDLRKIEVASGTRVAFWRHSVAESGR